jgi:hypothetical protein
MSVTVRNFVVGTIVDFVALYRCEDAQQTLRIDAHEPVQHLFSGGQVNPPPSTPSTNAAFVCTSFPSS